MPIPKYLFLLHISVSQLAITLKSFQRLSFRDFPLTSLSVFDSLYLLGNGMFLSVFQVNTLFAFATIDQALGRCQTRTGKITPVDPSLSLGEAQHCSHSNTFFPQSIAREEKIPTLNNLLFVKRNCLFLVNICSKQVPGTSLFFFLETILQFVHKTISDELRNVTCSCDQNYRFRLCYPIAAPSSCQKT